MIFSAIAVRQRTYELVEFLHDVVKVQAFPWAEFPHRVGLHNFCSTLGSLRTAKVSEIDEPFFSKPIDLLSIRATEPFGRMLRLRRDLFDLRGAGLGQEMTKSSAARIAGLPRHERPPETSPATLGGCFLAVLSQLTCWRRRSIFLVLATVVLQLLDLLVCSRCRPAHVPIQRPSRPATIGRRCFMEEYLRNGNRRKGRIGPRSKRHNALTDRVAITYAAAVLFPLTGR
jgi:hypothetical protein